MENKSFRKIFIGIILPAIVAILLFFLSVWLFILPIVEKNMMDAKKDMIGELTNTAWSLIDEYYQDYKDSVHTLEEAKELAARKVELMRYGPKSKDYFWITDTSPAMIMHPYRKDLNGKDLREYEDPNGLKLFVEAASIVDSAGEGYLDYYWQLRDDTSKIVQKISFVKGFPKWGWIVGTGIYVEDVRAEIAALKNRIIRITLVITFVIALLLFYVIRQSLKIEKKRSEAENGLKESKEKYKSLVEASTEGVLMFSNNKVIFVNQTFCTLSGYEDYQIMGAKYEDLFLTSWKEMLKKLDKPGKSVSLQAEMKMQNGQKREILLLLSKTYATNESRVIVTIKEISTQQRIEKARQHLSSEIEASLIVMNQPVGEFAEPTIECSLNTKIIEAVDLMKRKNKKSIFVKQNDAIIGFVSFTDIVHRVIAAGLSVNEPVSAIISAPVVSVNDDTLISEAILNFKQNNLSYLLVKDSEGKPVGVINKSMLAEVQTNTISVLLEEIDMCETADALKSKFLETPVIVDSLLNGGVYPKNITRLISAIIDGLTKRAITLAIEDIGTPPCKFAFFTMGSEARREQTLLTDQDNAIVFDDNYKDNEEVSQYFLKLGKRVNQILDYAGIQLCKGNNMAGNPKWNQALTVWKEYFSKWINNSDPQSILDASIFFDIRFVYGHKEYCSSLQNYFLKEAESKAVFLQHMAQSMISLKLPSINNNSDTDLKKILFVITGFARIYSLRLNSYEANTIIRLQKSHDANLINERAKMELTKVYDFLMSLRLREQINFIENGDNPQNIIRTDKLTEFEQNSLRKAVSIVGEYQIQLKTDYKGIL